MPQTQYYSTPHMNRGEAHAVSPPTRAETLPQRKRPKYTRSKTGCMTCRVKKVKVRPSPAFIVSCAHPTYSASVTKPNQNACVVPMAKETCVSSCLGSALIDQYPYSVHGRREFLPAKGRPPAGTRMTGLRQLARLACQKRQHRQQEIIRRQAESPST